MRYYLVTAGELAEILQVSTINGIRLCGANAAARVKPTAVMGSVEHLQDALSQVLLVRDDTVSLEPVLTRLKCQAA